MVGAYRRKAMRGGVVRVRSYLLWAGVCLLGGCGGSDPAGVGNAAAPSANTAPALSGTPANVVWQGEAYLFAPRATDTDHDTLVFEIENAPRWASFDRATGRLSGTPAPNDVGDVVGIRIGVRDGQHAVWLPPFDLTVRPVSRGSVLLTWQAPSENTDDSPLRDLAGFHIYWGTDPDAPAHTVSVGTHTLSYQFAGLSPGIYYFTTTAVNSKGIESALSDAAAMLVR